MSVPSAGGVNPTGKAPGDPQVAMPSPSGTDGQELSKHLVGIDSDGSSIVLAAKAGIVNWRDKLKKYYHTIIIIVAGTLAFLNQVTPLGEFLPATWRPYLTGAILLLGALTTFLKNNEVWVQNL